MPKNPGLYLTERLDIEADGQDVYGLVTVEAMNEALAKQLSLSPGAADAKFVAFLDVATANSDGTLTLRLPKGPITFVDAPGAEPEPGTALLVRPTGVASRGEPGYAYEVVPPKQIRQP